VAKARAPTDHIGTMALSYLTDQPPFETHDSTNIRMAVGWDPCLALFIHRNLALTNQVFLLTAMKLKYSMLMVSELRQAIQHRFIQILRNTFTGRLEMSFTKARYHFHMIRCSIRHSQSDSQIRINCTTVNNRRTFRRYTLSSGLLRQMGSNETRLLCGLCSSTESYSRSSITPDDSSKLRGKWMDKPMSYRGLASTLSHRSCRVLVTLSTAVVENLSQYRETSWKNDFDVPRIRQAVNLPGSLVQRKIGMAMMWRPPKHDRPRWVYQLFRIHMAVKNKKSCQIMTTR
jgi:hypothetical protein